ncbi:MAG: UDP-N-acetylglucosamine--N-acetylmuramyl-(pentapeptide) pyrophosphoryl-undecaprenol N-acetylglucosamine transferase [Chlamydiia bacterium]|nr:UDP-N-acetylglucosamine--N-acetylmuramyl-(pentapeptide) pyrophosphoryl-undecaprenol N-acetylglucosamine transferase [Chlamydiia bacterium]
MNKWKILIAAGGTGGHLFPAQQLAKMLQEKAKILFAGHKLEGSPFFAKEGISFQEIMAHPLQRGFLGALWKGFWQAVRLLRQFSPDVVVGFGSYHTFPLLLAAALLRKKLVLFEANCVMGKVNRFLAPAAEKIAFQFPLPVKKGVAVPLLPWRLGAPSLCSRKDARKAYHLDLECLTVLVFGGSQGASFLNEVAPQALAQLGQKIQVIHCTGKEEAVTLVEDAYRRVGITACVKGFEKEMPVAYAAADFALCRSGAGTIAELIRFEVPALLIPYPFATEDHQRKNGEFLADRVGGGRLVDQKDASSERLIIECKALLAELEQKRLALGIMKTQLQHRPHLAEVILSMRNS